MANDKENKIKARKALWKDVCTEYLREFCNRHGFCCEPNPWIANNYGTVAEVSDMFVSMEEIRYDVDNDVPVDKFSEWYWKDLEIYEQTGNKWMNYSTYCEGGPDKLVE